MLLHMDVPHLDKVLRRRPDSGQIQHKECFTVLIVYFLVNPANLLTANSYNHK